MSGRHDRSKRRKGKGDLEAKASSKTYLKRKVAKRQRTDITDTTAAMSQKSTASSQPIEFSQISCAASPEREEVDCKENKARGTMEPDHCSSSAFPEKVDSEEIDGIENNRVFPDDDSNQILPVEQFFGNLDVVQDGPQRSSAMSTFSKRELRRRNYYAKEDSSDGEQGGASL